MSSLRPRRTPLPAAARHLRPRSRPVASPPPTVSVVVPCHDYARYLPGCVESALAQEGVDVEVVVVDDASTDDSARVAHALCDDPRVSLIRNARNLGPVHTFNAGLAAAAGTYLVRLDADDLLTPGSLRRSTDLLEAVPSVGLVYGRPKHFTGAVPAAHRSAVRDWSVWPGRSWMELGCRQGLCFITSPEVVVRTSVVRAVGGQRPELAHTHDMEHWLRIASVSEVGRVNGADQALHREHELSLSVSAGAGPLRDLRQRAAAFDLLFQSPSLQGDCALHATARRALAVQALDRVCRAYDRGRVAVEPVEEYLALAEQLCVVDDLQEWAAVQRRLRGVAPVSSRTPPQLLRAARRRGREEWFRMRWQRTGV
jgi:hypothetical protein